MLKKSLICLSVFVVIGLLASCGSGKYADVKAVFDKIGSATDQLVASMEKAGNAPQVAAAINSYTEAMKSEQASFQNMMKKYPELKEAKEPPKELKESIDKLNSMGEKLMTAMTKLQNYAEDSAVKSAVQKMSELQLQ